MRVMGMFKDAPWASFWSRKISDTHDDQGSLTMPLVMMVKLL